MDNMSPRTGRTLKENGQVLNIADEMLAQKAAILSLRSITDPLPIKGGGKSSSSTQTRPDNTTPYSINDVVGTDAAAIMEFTNVSAVAGGTILITGLDMRLDVAAIPAGMSGYLAHLYSTPPAAITDNLTFNLPSGDRAKYLGSIPMATPVDLGDTLWSQNSVSKEVTLAEGSTSLFAVTTTLSAYTPTALVVKTLFMNTMEV